MFCIDILLNMSLVKQFWIFMANSDFGLPNLVCIINVFCCLSALVGKAFHISSSIEQKIVKNCMAYCWITHTDRHTHTLLLIYVFSVLCQWITIDVKHAGYFLWTMKNCICCQQYLWLLLNSVILTDTMVYNIQRTDYIMSWPCI